MPSYRLETPQTPDEEVEYLHEYHDDIEAILTTELHGLTGDGTEIHRVVVVEPVTASEQSALEDYLGSAVTVIDGQ